MEEGAITFKLMSSLVRLKLVRTWSGPPSSSYVYGCVEKSVPAIGTLPKLYSIPSLE